MNKKLNPSAILLLLFLLASVCFALYFMGHPVVLPTVSFKGQEQKIATSSGQLVTVQKVIDGDTIDVMINGQKTIVRFIGINAPETYKGKKSECFAEEAMRYVQHRIENKSITLVSDITQENKDKYERLLRYVILDDGTNLNLELVQKGYAREYTYKIPYQQQREFRSAQIDAKTNNVGLWSQCD